MHASVEPLRVELFDEEIESLRSFDPENQRSIQTHDELEICVADVTSGEDDGVLPFRLAKKDVCLIDIEPLRIEDHAQTLRVQTPDFGKALRSEERRVGKEVRSRWSPDHKKKKKKSE